ncbi:putative aflatoxin B1 aldehyde reductase member 2 [Rosellinia necatrix]|uniref:Putative aflatoxin B1 aldehyde reductase member 2 n=1 Tax=Rosellinia necatrix TaxID=77044 RepID=A0A1W2TQX7_ROSNE|nr:putative aflatoxin B1 aldehyde reductase member 2 [Rosellinia necatrix]
MPPKTPVNIILGTHTVGDKTVTPGLAHWDQPEEVQALLDTFHDRGHRYIDTGSSYPHSEERLGQAGAASRFTIVTKVRDGVPGSHDPAKIEASINRSLDDLKTPTVDTMMLHVPDRETPFEHAAKAINEAFKKGQFKRFGLSNYTAAEVQKFLDICEEKGYVKPSVYEGHYNAIFRSGEKELFPLLRKHNIPFYGYSPAAGGLFSGNAGTSTTSKRWDSDNIIGKNYNGFYGHPLIQAAVPRILAAAEKHGISGHAAALRWTAFHSILDGSHGDGIIFAVSRMEQLHKTLDAIDAGPLPADLAEAFSALYSTTEGPSLPYHL